MIEYGGERSEKGCLKSTQATTMILLRYLQVKFNVQPPTDVVIDTTDKDIHDYSRSYSIATNDR